MRKQMWFNFQPTVCEGCSLSVPGTGGAILSTAAGRGDEKEDEGWWGCLPRNLCRYALRSPMGDQIVVTLTKSIMSNHKTS